MLAAVTMLCDTVVGRERELAQIGAAVASAAAGAGQALFVLGEAGVGKSRLAAECARLAASQQLPVLWGRAVEAESPVTLRPVAEALLGGVRSGALTRDPQLDPFRAALGRLVPQWRLGGEAGDDSLVVVAEALLRLLGAAAGGRGCLLVLEDLHWADPETLLVLEYLADHLPGEPTLCLATARSERPAPAVTLARTLTARRAAAVIDVPRLGPDDVAGMVRACLDVPVAPADVERFVTSRADGLPFFVEELLGGLLEAGALVPADGGWTSVSRLVPAVPLTFADTVRRRLASLAPQDRRVLTAACVLGRRFDWTLLPAVAELDEPAVLAALGRAVDVQLVATDADGGFWLRHALTRDAILAQLLPPERATLAATAAAAVAAAHPGLEGDWAELAATLHEQAGQRQRAAELLHEVARRAAAGGALASAEAAVDRALTLATAPATRTALAETRLEVLVLAGRNDRVDAAAGDLLATLEAGGAAAERHARVHLLLARAAVTSGDWDEASRRLTAARAAAGHAAGDELAARLDALAAHVAIGAGQPQDGVRLAEQALAAAERSRLPSVACEALEVVGRGVRERDVAAAERAFDRARVIAEEHGLVLWRIRALHELGTIDLLDSGRLDRLEEARRLARQHGALATAAMIAFHLSAVLWSRRRLEEAEARLEECVELARRLGLSILPSALVMRGALAASRDDEGAMEAAVAEAHAAAPGSPEVEAGEWGRCRFALAITRADDVAAREALDRAMVVLRRHPTIPLPWRGIWALLCTVQHAGGDAARDEVRASGALGIRVIRGFLSLADAVALGRAGRHDEAEAALATAMAHHLVYADAHWWNMTGLRLVAEAALADGWGQPEAWLREALAWFDDHGYDHTVAKCRALLRHAGVAVPRRGRGDASVPTGLRARGVTSREVDVLTLVAEGLSNREIGARLFVSPKTVEKHVASLLAKTGSRGRAQLATLAASHLNASGMAGGG